jgi:hypothetical protein
MSVHFAFTWPVFGTAKRPKAAFHHQDTVYYQWFQYLRRNEDYRKTCESNGIGPCARLYEDFGDVYTTDFKTWWTANGARLFGEPPVTSIAVFAGGQIDPKVNEGRPVMLLSVPLDLPQSYLIKRFREILSKHHDGQRGKRHNAASRAMYPTGGRIDIEFLKKALAVWDGKKASPDKQLWLLANELNLVPTSALKPSEYNVRGDGEVTDKKSVLAVTASRYLKKAQKMIDNTAQGKFPYE